LLVGTAAIAFATTPLHTWMTGDTLQATDLNGNFTNLQTQITALQQPAPSEILVDTVGAGSAAFGSVNTAVSRGPAARRDPRRPRTPSRRSGSRRSRTDLTQRTQRT
jgi:hypothetical protein